LKCPNPPLQTQRNKERRKKKRKKKRENRGKSSKNCLEKLHFASAPKITILTIPITNQKQIHLKNNN
jgi:hypothetical protein